MNANNEKFEKLDLKEDIEYEFGVCDDVYEAVRDIVGELTGDYIFGIAIAIAAEEECLAEEGEL